MFISKKYTYCNVNKKFLCQKKTQNTQKRLLFVFFGIICELTK